MQHRFVHSICSNTIRSMVVFAAFRGFVLLLNALVSLLWHQVERATKSDQFAEINRQFANKSDYKCAATLNGNDPYA